MSTEPTGAERDLRDKPYDPTGPYERAQEADGINTAVAEQFSPYRLDAAAAFALGSLVGLLTTALVGNDLSVSPVTDQGGNYLRLLRFTLNDQHSPPQSWILAMVVE